MATPTLNAKAFDPKTADPKSVEPKSVDPRSVDPKTSDTVQALVQLLRSRSSEEIRQRMYDNPPGSP